MGNRGIIHDAGTRTLLNRRWQHQAWVCCRLEFKDFQHPIMGAGAYTELFFLDEATALAAGHRPCAYCRRADFNAFKGAWLLANPVPGEEFVSIRRIDRALHGERVDRRRRQIRYQASLETLPDGVMVSDARAIFLVWGRHLFDWQPHGYERRVERDKREVTVLTPRPTVLTLGAGYRPAIHRSALDLG